MAEIEVKGYVNKPSTKEGSKGKFGVFTLASSQKEKDGTRSKVFYGCVYFAGEAPPDSAYVTVKGWFSTKPPYKAKDDTYRNNLCINVQSMEVSPPREGAGPASAPPKDDFGL